MAPGDVTRSVSRTFELLGAIIEHGGLTLADAAKTTDLATSTALRLIRSLEQTEFVLRGEDNVYRVGPRLLQIGAKAIADTSCSCGRSPPWPRSPRSPGSRPYLSAPGPRGTALYMGQIEGTHAIGTWGGSARPSPSSEPRWARPARPRWAPTATPSPTTPSRTTPPRVAAPIYDATRPDRGGTERRRADRSGSTTTSAPGTGRSSSSAARDCRPNWGAHGLRRRNHGLVRRSLAPQSRIRTMDAARRPGQCAARRPFGPGSEGDVRCRRAGSSPRSGYSTCSTCSPGEECRWPRPRSRVLSTCPRARRTTCST